MKRCAASNGQSLFHTLRVVKDYEYKCWSESLDHWNGGYGAYLVPDPPGDDLGM